MSADKFSTGKELLHNITEAIELMGEARFKIYYLDIDRIPESDLSEICAYSKNLLKQVKEASASMIDRLEGRQ